ncbi:hypothetical protein [Candidatus Symbiopectobacterium sp. NZEC135]|uniref:hypothetical protein n=1 Tax=Candidatus Symbiopectobacterium sp. NZEC135 TaxID=2820471 RepID=UPI002227B175|nr:hypothetical protein [Candidatus Symbiopectobacterium sp. NZEC135]MCW2481737.1 hypothetical protein [Candidatus Symbiopectobacterium sp. NZEC135]
MHKRDKVKKLPIGVLKEKKPLALTVIVADISVRGNAFSLWEIPAFAGMTGEEREWRTAF